MSVKRKITSGWLRLYAESAENRELKLCRSELENLFDIPPQARYVRLAVAVRASRWTHEVEIPPRLPYDRWLSSDFVQVTGYGHVVLTASLDRFLVETELDGKRVHFCCEWR